MSSNKLHVAEKLNLLDPQLPWRKEMKIVLNKFTELLPTIRHLLCGHGDMADRKELPENFLELSTALEVLIL